MSGSRRQALAQTVAVGKDGFLFHRFEQSFEQLFGGTPMPAHHLARWAALLETRHAWCAARGIRYVFMVVPEKHAVYDDKLPGWQLDPGRPVMALRDALRPATRQDFIYPRDALVDGRDEAETFLRTDVHWTYWGAYLAYRQLAAAAVPLASPIAEAGLLRCPYRLVGDLGIRLDPEPEEEAEDIHPPGPAAVKVLDTGMFGTGQVEIYETGDPSKPRGILFRDSNASSMLRFLGEHFSRLVCVATLDLFQELVLSEKPDIVITQTSERHLLRPESPVPGAPLLFPDDAGHRSFNEVTGLTPPLPVPATEWDLPFGIGTKAANHRGKGWSYEEAGFVWMVGDRSMLHLPQAQPGHALLLELDLVPHLNPDAVRPQRMEIVVAGNTVLATELGAPATVTATIPEELAAGRSLDICIRHPDGFAPRVYGADDNRHISLRVSHLRLRRA